MNQTETERVGIMIDEGVRVINITEEEVKIVRGLVIIIMVEGWIS